MLWRKNEGRGGGSNREEGETENKEKEENTTVAETKQGRGADYTPGWGLAI